MTLLSTQSRQSTTCTRYFGDPQQLHSGGRWGRLFLVCRGAGASSQNFTCRLQNDRFVNVRPHHGHNL